MNQFNEHSVEPHTILERLERGSSVDLSTINREERLLVINRFLAYLTLRPISSLGDSEKGEVEWIGIEKITLHSHIVGVTFQSKIFLDGNFRYHSYLVLFHTNTLSRSGTVVIPVLESKSQSGDNTQQLLLIEEFRPALGEKIIGFPRGFPSSGIKSDEHATKLALKELHEETGILSGSEVKILSTVEIGTAYADTGNHNVINSLVEVRLELSVESIQKLCLTTHEEEKSGVIRRIVTSPHDAASLMNDQHSCTALLKWHIFNSTKIS